MAKPKKQAADAENVEAGQRRRALHPMRRARKAIRETGTARTNRSPADFGLIESINDWTELPIYQGTPAQFIASGLLTQAQIPGELGCPRSRVFRFERDGKKYAVSFRPTARLFKLAISRPTEEEIRRIDEKRERERERESPGRQEWLLALGVDAIAREDDRSCEPEEPSDDVESADDDDDWPPNVSHNAAIKRGDGNRWHYLGTGEALLLEGVLDAEDIPGNPACKNRWRAVASYGGKYVMATRLGKHVAVTLLDRPSIMRCHPLKFKAG